MTGLWRWQRLVKGALILLCVNIMVLVKLPNLCVCVCVHTLIKMGHENHFRILKSHQRVITMLSFKLSSVGWL